MKKLYREHRSLIGEDRVHPNAAANEVMAQIFLKAQGFDVPQLDDYDALAALSQSVYPEWENTRFALEQRSKSVDFVIWCAFRGEKDEQKLENLLRERLKSETSPFLQNCFTRYVNERKEILECKKKLIEFTQTVSVD